MKSKVRVTTLVITLGLWVLDFSWGEPTSPSYLCTDVCKMLFINHSQSRYHTLRYAMGLYDSCMAKCKQQQQHQIGTTQQIYRATTRYPPRTFIPVYTSRIPHPVRRTTHRTLRPVYRTTPGYNYETLYQGRRTTPWIHAIDGQRDGTTPRYKYGTVHSAHRTTLSSNYGTFGPHHRTTLSPSVIPWKDRTTRQRHTTPRRYYTRKPFWWTPRPHNTKKPAVWTHRPHNINKPAIWTPKPHNTNKPAVWNPRPHNTQKPVWWTPRPHNTNKPAVWTPRPHNTQKPVWWTPRPYHTTKPVVWTPGPHVTAKPAVWTPRPHYSREPSNRKETPNSTVWTPPRRPTRRGLPRVCGIKPAVRRIVGGSPASECEFPWVVSILSVLFCGGTILDETHILTAAHCFKDANGKLAPVSKVKIRVGASDMRKGTFYKVKRLQLHPQHNNHYNDYDIAVLTLSERLRYGPCVAPLCVAKIGESPEASDKCVAAGWGIQHSRSYRMSRHLMVVPLPIVQDHLCQKAYGPNFFNSLKMCAGNYHEGGVDSCKGDSGGPLMCKTKGVWVQHGIVSFGRGCGEKHLPGVYTKLSHPRIREFVVKSVMNG